MTTADPDPERLPSYPLMPLFAAPASLAASPHGSAKGDAVMGRLFYRTTATIDLFTADSPFPYDERFWSHLRESLAEDALLVGVGWKEQALSREECACEVEDLDDRLGDEATDQEIATFVAVGYREAKNIQNAVTRFA
jgi:hypothetical protein